MQTKSTYSIHDSKTGEVLIQSVELDTMKVENLSSDNAEGHFSAASLPELNLGDITIYAILR